jgi:hypothetical protein
MNASDVTNNCPVKLGDIVMLRRDIMFSESNEIVLAKVVRIPRDKTFVYVKNINTACPTFAYEGTGTTAYSVFAYELIRHPLMSGNLNGFSIEMLRDMLALEDLSNSRRLDEVPYDSMHNLLVEGDIVYYADKSYDIPILGKLCSNENGMWGVEVYKYMERDSKFSNHVARIYDIPRFSILLYPFKDNHEREHFRGTPIIEVNRIIREIDQASKY